MKKLLAVLSVVTFFVMASQAMAEHMLGEARNDPWNNCTSCHGVDLNGGSAISCMSCHNDFTYPDLPATGHMGDDRFNPQGDCTVCHGEDLSGRFFGVDFAPSCYTCHGPLWTPLPPVADPNGPYTVDASLPVQFDGSDSVDPDGVIVSYYWDFGDGAVGSGVSPVHTYMIADTYTVTLTVTDDGALTDSAVTSAVIAFLDTDLDGISDDGDNSGVQGDGLCTGGETLNCDDNCRLTPNADQADEDSDGVGSVCDNCPADMNPLQWDCDDDTLGDACDAEADTDADGVADACDNCPSLANPEQHDADGDGMGNACDPVLDGDYTIDGIDTAGDMDALSGNTEITGNLTVKNTNLTSLAGLESLSSVGGDVTISKNDALTSLSGLENLTSIGGAYIGNNAALTSLGALANITGVAGDFQIVINPALTSLVGLENLTSVGGVLNISENDALTSLGALVNITSTAGGVSISNNAALTSLSGLGTLTSVGGVSIVGNAGLTSLGGLETLTSAGGVYINNNASLTDLSGLANITSIAGGLAIGTNAGLTDLSGLENLTSVGGNLSIGSNFGLTGLSGLENLTSAGGLYISSNRGLTSLSALANLTSTGGHVYLTGNNVLGSLAGLENLTGVDGDVYISENDVLTSLSGLNQVHSDGAMLLITFNTSLCMEAALALEAQLRLNGFTGDAHIVQDACDDCPLDDDVDEDGVCTGVDNCPDTPNPDQANSDDDAMGDACDADDDNDGIEDAEDMCPLEDATDGDANEDGCIDTLVDLPDVLDELDLADKTVKGLNKKIDRVEKALDKGNVRKAIKKLEALIKKINKSRGKKIDEVEADMLVDYVENLINGLVD